MHLRTLGIFLVLLAIPSLSLKDSPKHLQLQAGSDYLNIFKSASFLQEIDTETDTNTEIVTVIDDDVADKAIIDATIAATDDTDSEKTDDDEAEDEIITSISTIGDVAPPGMTYFLQDDLITTPELDEGAEKTEDDATVLDSVDVDVEGYNEEPDGEEQYTSNSF